MPSLNLCGLASRRPEVLSILSRVQSTLGFRMRELGIRDWDYGLESGVGV